jgi:hypothetical protein
MEVSDQLHAPAINLTARLFSKNAQRIWPSRLWQGLQNVLGYNTALVNSASSTSAREMNMKPLRMCNQDAMTACRFVKDERFLAGCYSENHWSSTTQRRDRHICTSQNGKIISTPDDRNVIFGHFLHRVYACAIRSLSVSSNACFSSQPTYMKLV